MLQRLLLGLSQSDLARRWIEAFPLSRRVARRFIAGETLEEAVEAVHALNAQHIKATLDHLGENTRTRDEAVEAAQEYHRILDAIDRHGLDSGISLKPTQMGLALSEDLCFENIKGIAERARDSNNFVRIDMESSQYTGRTLRIYERLREVGHDQVGVVIQSYLYRSEEDIERLIKLGANVRLCKGAYAEPPSVAFPDKRDVDRNFQRLLQQMWRPEALTKGVYAAVATHDEELIRWARQYAQRHGISRERFEFQMLHGVRRALQVKLVREGYRVRVYVSYGREWYPYFMRRLAERPANVLFLARQLLRA